MQERVLPQNIEAEQAVLGANRTPEQQVLGANRDAATGDMTNMAGEATGFLGGLAVLAGSLFKRNKNK